MFYYLLEKGSRRVISGQRGYPYLVLSFFNYCKMYNLSQKRKGLFPGKVAVESVDEYVTGGKKNQTNKKPILNKTETTSWSRLYLVFS